MRSPLPLLALLTACPGPPAPDASGYIAPADGQSAVPTDQILLVRTGGMELPPNYPLPTDFIRVVDLAEGGVVPGEIVRSGDDLLFTPNEPWHVDRRYSWTIDAAVSGAHGPEFSFPESLQGTAVFDTSDDLWLLGAGNDASMGLTCLVFSRPVEATETGDIAITIDDLDIEDVIWRLPENAGDASYDLLDGDLGLGTLCLLPPPDMPVFGTLRLFWGGLGPWSTELKTEPLADMIAELRRQDSP